MLLSLADSPVVRVARETWVGSLALAKERSRYNQPGRANSEMMVWPHAQGVSLNSSGTPPASRGTNGLSCQVLPCMSSLQIMSPEIPPCVDMSNSNINEAAFLPDLMFLGAIPTLANIFHSRERSVAKHFSLIMITCFHNNNQLHQRHRASFSKWD